MQITRITARPVMAPLNRPVKTASGEIPSAALVLIDLHTDAGVTGHAYVFAFSEPMLKPLVACVDALAHLVKGDVLAPLDIDAKLKKRNVLIDTPGLLGIALSGVDMAAWDAYAKSLGLPLARALGAQPKPIKAYNSCGLWIGAPDALADEACTLLSEGGFSAVKIRLGRNEFRDDMAAVRKVKSSIGDSAHLMSDFNQSLNTGEALHRCRALDGEGLYWIEEPVRHDNYSGYAKIARETATPIQTGENLLNTFEMQKAINAQAADYYMPDVQRIGGVTGWMRAAAIAHAHDLSLSSHLFPEISRHLLCATPTCHWLEYVDWASAVLQEPTAIEDGHAITPEQPGIGINWDEKAVKKYTVE